MISKDLLLINLIPEATKNLHFLLFLCTVLLQLLEPQWNSDHIFWLKYFLSLLFLVSVVISARVLWRRVL